MKVFGEDKRRLLIQRGFLPEEIDSHFRNYISGTGEWNILSISPEELDKTDELKDIAGIFAKDSVKEIRGAVGGTNDFRGFSSPQLINDSYRVSAAILDPYVARLVLAAGRCGINTCMSCDGWHKKMDREQRSVRIWMADRYSTLWFWIIAEKVFGEKWSKTHPLDWTEWVGRFEPDNNTDDVTGFSVPSKVIYRIEKGDEATAYKKINLYAAFLEDNHDQLCRIREKWISVIKEGRTDEDIDMISFLGIRRIICESVEPELFELAAKWRNHKETSSNEIQAWQFV